MKCLFFLLGMCLFLLPAAGDCQTPQRVSFKTKDSTDISYLAIKPRSQSIEGALIIFNWGQDFSTYMGQTKLHNVAFGEELLTVFVPLNAFFMDKPAIQKINTILTDITDRFSVDTSKFAFLGYGFIGSSILRYTELAFQNPETFPIRPKAFIGAELVVDLIGYSERLQNKMQKSILCTPCFFDSKNVLDTFQKTLGTPANHSEKYKAVSPFNQRENAVGHEAYLKHLPIRLYYETDVEWYLEQGFSLYDSELPDASELVKRLRFQGNRQAEFIPAKSPVVGSDGRRLNYHPWNVSKSLSMIDEVECVHWIKQKLDIFDGWSWVSPYRFAIPKGWRREVFKYPVLMPYKGVNDIRFPAGWSDPSSGEFWSYLLLWYIEGNPKINADTLRERLAGYFGPLQKNHSKTYGVPPEKVISTTAAVKKIKTATNDLETFEGEVKTIDHFTQRPLTLNILMHIRACEEQNHTLLFLEVSPQSYGHPIWKEFEYMRETFACTNKE